MKAKSAYSYKLRLLNVLLFDDIKEILKSIGETPDMDAIDSRYHLQKIWDKEIERLIISLIERRLFEENNID